MTQALTLEAIVDDAAFLSYEHQLHLADLAEQLGEHDWHVDLDAGTFTLTGRSTLQATVHLLGSTSEGAGSWLWGWANLSGLSPAVTELATRVGEFGRRHGIPELAEAELVLTPDTAARLTDAAKIITGHWTSYSGALEPGSRAHFLVDAAQLALPRPTTPRCLRVLTEGLTTGLVSNPSRALGSYARRRGLAMVGGPDGPYGGAALRMELPDREVSVAFDQSGRISNLSGHAGPAGPALPA